MSYVITNAINHGSNLISKRMKLVNVGNTFIWLSCIV